MAQVDASTRSFDDLPLLLRKVVDVPPIRELRHYKELFTAERFKWLDEIEAAGSCAVDPDVRTLPNGAIDSTDENFGIPADRLFTVLKLHGDPISPKAFACVVRLMRADGVLASPKSSIQRSQEQPQLLLCSFSTFFEWIPSFALAAKVETGAEMRQTPPQPSISAVLAAADAADVEAAAESAEAQVATEATTEIPGAVRFAKPSVAAHQREKTGVPAENAELYEMIKSKLPTSKTDAAAVAKRKEMWNSFDVNGNGYLSLAEIQKGIRDVLKIDALFDTKPVIMRAFQAARKSAPSRAGEKVPGRDDDYVTFAEFRNLLRYLVKYFELWSMFKIIDTSEDGRLDEDEWVKMGQQLQEWGIDLHGDCTETALRALFRKADTDGAGKVLFIEFADFALSHSLDLFNDEDEA